jgi:hypothetical protein
MQMLLYDVWHENLPVSQVHSLHPLHLHPVTPLHLHRPPAPAPPILHPPQKATSGVHHAVKAVEEAGP